MLKSTTRVDVTSLETIFTGQAERHFSLFKTLEPLKQKLLKNYFTSLINVATPSGFVGQADAVTAWQRHILDSLLPLPLIGDHLVGSQDKVVDLGPGAGLPSLPLAIVLANVHFTLLEAQKKRAVFLSDQVQQLGLTNAGVVCQRVEDHKVRYNVALARAFQKPLVTLELALHILNEKGKVLYWRSKRFDQNQQAVERRIKDMGYQVAGFYAFQSPLGDRGLYVFEKNGETSQPYPRAYSKIMKDKFTMGVI